MRCATPASVNFLSFSMAAFISATPSTHGSWKCEVAHQLYDSVGSQDRTLKIFTTHGGGAEHCQVDNRQVGTDYIADWLAARLR
jgi:hypothetical protein